MSYDMIIPETEIDSLNNFKFKLNNLSKTDRFYRLHVSKRESPRTSLIIGGPDQNFLFVIAKKIQKLQ